jgi:hypothetical protein
MPPYLTENGRKIRCTPRPPFVGSQGRQWKHLSSLRAEILSMAGLPHEPVTQKMDGDRFFWVLDVLFDDIKQEALAA